MTGKSWEVGAKIWLALPKMFAGAYICHHPQIGGAMAALSRLHDWQGKGIKDKVAIEWIARARALILKHNVMTPERLSQVVGGDRGTSQLEMF